MSTHPQGNHQSRSSIAWRRLARVASSFRIARFSLAVGLPSHIHSSSWKEVRSVKVVAIIGCGAVVFGIVADQGWGGQYSHPLMGQGATSSAWTSANWAAMTVAGMPTGYTRSGHSFQALPSLR